MKTSLRPFAIVLFLHLLPLSSRAAPGGQNQAFDYYLLALSWSPAYCAAHPENRDQCGNKGFGLVLHGLWPQYAKGRQPDSCGAAEIPAQAAQLGIAIFPSTWLMKHEWKKHGACTGLDATAYFMAAQKAVASIKVPPALQKPPQTRALTGGEIAAAFIAVNPGLTKDALLISCKDDQFTEIRICMNKNLAPIRCERGNAGKCGAGPLTVQKVGS